MASATREVVMDGSAAVGNATPLVGARVAYFLSALDPELIYDHLNAHALRDYGIFYDEKLHLLIFEGVAVELPVQTPAELIAEGVDWITEEAELMVRAWKLARTIHYLLWPLELPPSRTVSDPIEGFDADVVSIAQRGERAYRDGQPSWRPELKPTRRRR